MNKAKNKFQHNKNDTTSLFIMRNGVEHVVLIDTEDHSRVKCNSWSLCPQNKSQEKFRVRANKKLDNGKTGSIYLHRLITNAPKDKEVDHINNNSMDNRKSNLRIVTRAQNAQNFSSARIDNKSSGIRNVYYDKTLGKYKVKIRLGGKDIHIGVFDDIKEAEKTAIKTRKKYMPFSLEGTNR